MWSTTVAKRYMKESSQGAVYSPVEESGLCIFLSGVNNNLLVFAKTFENRRRWNIGFNHFIAFKAEICVCGGRYLERGPVCTIFFRADGLAHCYRAAL